MPRLDTVPQQARQDQVRPPAALVPFAQASKRSIELSSSFQVTPGTAPVPIGAFDLVPNGFIRAVDIHVKTVTAAAGGTPVVKDGWPFTILQNIQFSDTGGQKMDDLSGYALMQDNIAGGDQWRGDPRTAHDYSASTTTPDFRLRLARELAPDGRGSLPNLSGSQKYRLRLNIDALANLYSTAPSTNAPTLQIDVVLHIWLLPAPADGGGRPQQRRPPLLGLSQYRTSYWPNETVAAGQVKYPVKATGNLWKYLIIIARDGTGARSDLVFPDPLTLRIDNFNIFNNAPLAEVIRAADAMLGPGRSGRDTGVLIIPFDYGLDKYLGGHGVSSWLPTSTATYIELSGRQATNTAGTFEVLVNEISTAEIDPAERSAIGSNTGTWQPGIPADVPGGM